MCKNEPLSDNDPLSMGLDMLHVPQKIGVVWPVISTIDWIDEGNPRFSQF